ncbi:hypothetical protein [Natrinema salinisoli]|uniref:hypothetical protein n=1 Tax=Natrinema salinisoli TaxID=2878535 RepID=UPI001CF08F86|nr:hypothetical protein [Natrinema salinisoli]
MKSKRFLSASFIIAVLLVGAILFPSTLMKPYNGDSTHYAIAHESSEHYEEYIKHASHRSEGGIPVESLSETQRRAFEEAKEQEPISSGLRSLGRPPVCSPGLLLCDEYEKFPHPINEGSTEYGHFAVEDSTGDRFLIKIGQAGATWRLYPFFIYLTKCVVLGPYALFLLYRRLSARSAEPTFFSVGYGATLLTVAVAYPYILMFTDISLPSWHLPFLAIVTWSVILVGIWRDRNKDQSEPSHISKWGN